MREVQGRNEVHLLNRRDSNMHRILGLGLWNRSRLGLYTAQSHWQVDIVGIWFGWIAVAALGSALATSFITSPNVVH